jgi:hypothetical protein
MSSAPPMKILSVHFDEFVKKLPSMEGKTVAVTGSTSGTGLIFAKTCATLGAKVILLNRPSDRAQAAFDAVKAAAPDCKLMSVPCDLQSFKSVRSAAALMIASCPEVRQPSLRHAPLRNAPLLLVRVFPHSPACLAGHEWQSGRGPSGRAARLPAAHHVLISLVAPLPHLLHPGAPGPGCSV